MAHNTFEADNESANNNYVATAKRQKAIRRYVKLFFRLVAALAIIILAVLVVILALELDHCREDSKHTYHHNRTCEELYPGDKWCLTKHYPATWDAAESLCHSLGQTLPTKDMVNTYPWLEKYLTGTWANKNGEVFKSLGETTRIWNGAGTDQQQKDFFCVS
uniref:EEV glycoprotein n=1 Tax=Pseudocowpox virus TaxID=129726 RepID=G3G9Y1_9POXV|nr:EEV glycoprotein [Pseudocowpox virus]